MITTSGAAKTTAREAGPTTLKPQGKRPALRLGAHTPEGHSSAQDRVKRKPALRGRNRAEG